MSTQSPLPPTPKGARNNNRRHNKRNATPNMQKALLTTPPSSPPRHSSPATYDDSNDANSSKKKKNPRSTKKQRDIPNNNGHRHTSSQPSLNSPSQMKNSPHYAGPTFHASPAPSALPIPSFFSKSVPDSDSAPGLDTDSDALEADPDLENTPSKPKTRTPCGDEQKTTTPLDFLFKAAIEARSSKTQYDSDNEAGHRSPAHTGFSTPVSQRKTESPAGGIFPLDMENTEASTPPTDDYSIAASYKNRMDALRSTSLPSVSAENLDEGQRKAKTEALKDLLLNPRPQRPTSSASPFSAHDKSGTLDGRVRPVSDTNVPHFATPFRAASGPPSSSSHTPKQHQIARSGAYSPFSSSQSYNFDPSQNQGLSVQPLASPPDRNNLANGSGRPFAAPHAIYRQPNTVDSPVRRTYGSPLPQRSKLSQTVQVDSPTSNKSLDSKKMEDDLRRILKLDAAQGMQSSSMQSSYA